jgi:CYTH domain-containing protein
MTGDPEAALETVPSLKYAVVERERRFLPRRAPDLSAATRVMQIEDRYVDGTRLRLRTVREPGSDLVRKLGQKVRLAPGDATAIAHTTLYLDDAEHALLSALPAVSLSKTRHVLPYVDGLDVAVDVFHGPLSGLTTAEIDLGAGGPVPEPVPTWWGDEVTAVEAFTGHALARLDAEGFARLMLTYPR